MNPLLVLLDLDSTLIYTTVIAGGSLPYDFIITYPGFSADDPPRIYYAYIRPGVKVFLNRLVHEFRVGVFTAALPQYAYEVCKHLFGDMIVRLECIYTNNDCARVNFRERVSLRKILACLPGIDLKRTILIDDDIHVTQHSHGNTLHVTSFEDPVAQHIPQFFDDLELALCMCKYILNDCKDVRTILQEYHPYEWKVRLFEQLPPQKIMSISTYNSLFPPPPPPPSPFIHYDDVLEIAETHDPGK